jgi:selenocysteine lyase/cysteine desulfurase
MNESIDIGYMGLRKKARPYELEIPDFFNPVDNLKQSFSQLIHNEESDRIAIIPSVSYGIANACNNIPFEEGDEIIIAGDQFPSNVYPWMSIAEEKGCKIVTIPSPDVMEMKGLLWNMAILEAINGKTKVVALSHVHWSEGIIYDLYSIRQRLNDVEGYLIIDGTQSIGALPFSIAEFQPDALIVAGYKWLMGPYGIGLAYYNERFDQGHPVEHNWINRLNSENFAGLVNYQPQFKSGAHRYCVGENSNFIAIPMLNYSINKILEWTPESIQDYCGSISNEALHQLSASGYEVCPEGQRSNHLFGIKIPENVSGEDLKNELAAAHIYVSVRGNYLRVAPYVFNNEDDIRKLCNILI